MRIFGSLKATVSAAAILVASQLCGQADAQSGLRNQPAGFCTSPSLASATGLSGFTCNFVSGANLENVQYGVICTYTQGIVWRDDGVAPTASPGSGGEGVSAGSCFGYNGNFQAIQFIQQSLGAVVGATLYK